MLIGNLCALTQDNVKRLFAFSSVAHAGYVLVGLAAVARLGSGGESVLFYLLAYAFMNIGAFTVVQLMSRRTESDLQFDRDWSGIARQFPVLGLAMAVFMLSLGGIPPTAGFIGKYALFRSAIDAGLVSLVIIGVLNSAVSVYFYLRVVVAMYMREQRQPSGSIAEAYGGARLHALQGPGAMASDHAVPTPGASVEGEDEPSPPRLAERGAFAARVVVVVCLVATLWFGFAPNLGGIPGIEQVMDWARQAASSVR
jgi:formate hydrogenlyase subunit 3/multisubunit Na+/H+ antiporter MnhD subunit